MDETHLVRPFHISRTLADTALVRFHFVIATVLLASAGCASSRQRAAAPAPPSSPPPAAAMQEVHLAPPVVASPATSDIRQVNFQAEPTAVEPLPQPLRPAVIGSLTPEYPIDLVTALRLADADNLQIALAREQIQQAFAEYNTAGVLWLPSLRAGVHWNKHEGPLLSSGGNLVNVSRTSLYAGAGAAAVGGGSPAIPGLFANFNVADAIFQPLAVQQRWGAREQGATVARNNALLDVAIAYLELLRVAQDLAIQEDLRQKIAEVTRITEAFASTGQGLQADADRMRVELGLRDIEIRRSHEAYILASARLAQLLRLEPCIRLQPIEPHVVQLCFVSRECSCADLVAQALMTRPELAQNRYLVGEAVQLLRSERYAPLLPSVLLGASYGGFGGGRGSDISGFDDRFDFDATAFWELRNLGYGEAAARQAAGSRVRQAQIQELQALDQVAREVTEVHAQVQLREQQIAAARDLLRFATDSYDHNLVRIERGQGLPIEVLQSTQALLQARREYLRSVIDYNSAQFTLQRALGWPVGAPQLSG
jgi:outer membrane protein TolC